MAIDWHVTRQETVPVIDTSGRLVYAKNVYFRVDTEPGEGHEDHVQVEDRPGYSDKATALIESKVDEIKKLFSA